MKVKNSNKNIFIHIPKCGGSSFVGLLKDSIEITPEQAKTPTHRIQAIGNVAIKHIDFSTSNRKFRSPEIFKPLSNSNFIDTSLFMIVRNPVDRLLSEFNFQYHILNGKGGNPNAAIISSLKPTPHSLLEYSKHKATQNYQCKFLLGRNLADPSPVTETDFDRIINTIEKLNIHCGVTSKFQHFLNLFSSQSSIDLKPQFIHRKRTPDQLKINILESTSEQIKKLNEFDFALYNYVLGKLVNSDLEKAEKYTPNISNQFIP